MNASRTVPAFCAALVVALAGVAGGCSTTTAGGAVGAERSQLLLVSSEQLEQMSAQTYTRLRTEAAAKGALDQDAAMLARIRGIAENIRPKTAVFRPDAPGWNWEISLIESDEINAFCMPGGKIVFYSGLIKKLGLTDDEIAVVMGHEVAHALREHSREQVSQALAAQTAIDVGASLLGWGQGASSLANVAYEALVATRFSRADETEADRIGLELAARAGYNPRAGVSLWQKMMAKSGGGPPEFLSSHPAGDKRIEEVNAVLPVVLPLYEATRK